MVSAEEEEKESDKECCRPLANVNMKQVTCRPHKGQATSTDRERESLITRVLEETIMVSLYPRTCIHVILQLVDDDGGALAVLTTVRDHDCFETTPRRGGVVGGVGGRWKRRRTVLNSGRTTRQSPLPHNDVTDGGDALPSPLLLRRQY